MQRKVIGLDYGRARIGIAASDETGRIAFARKALERRGKRRDLAILARLIAEEGADLVVVGLPLDADGAEGAAASAARRFAERLRGATGLDVALHDERYSTLVAAERLRELGLDERRIRPRIDAEAARVILQGYLDSVAS